MEEIDAVLPIDQREARRREREESEKERCDVRRFYEDREIRNRESGMILDRHANRTLDDEGTPLGFNPPRHTSPPVTYSSLPTEITHMIVERLPMSKERIRIGRVDSLHNQLSSSLIDLVKHHASLMELPPPPRPFDSADFLMYVDHFVKRVIDGVDVPLRMIWQKDLRAVVLFHRDRERGIVVVDLERDTILEGGVGGFWVKESTTSMVPHYKDMPRDHDHPLIGCFQFIVALLTELCAILGCGLDLSHYIKSQERMKNGKA